MAAQIDVRKSVADPAFDARVNVEGTINVLEAARQTEVRRVVNTSTGGAIYGEGKIIPAPEDHPVAPEAPYGQSKFAAEGYCELFHRLHGMSTVSLRYGNVYGPRQDPLGEAGVIAIFCGKLLDGGGPRSSATASRRATTSTSKDVVAANLLAADSSAGGAFNIGLGQERSVLDVVQALAPHAPNGFEPEFAPERPGEVRHIAIDPTRAEAELGWRAQVGLEDGIERTLASLR